MSLTVSVIYGSVRADRQGIKATRYLNKKLKERDIKVYFADPMHYNFPFLDKMYKEFPEGKAPENMEELAQKFRESDGFLMVSGEYNHGVPPAMKNLIDHFQTEYFFKPSAIASYSAGRYGGVRAAVQLRSILGELGMPAISSALAFPKVQHAFSDDGKPQQDYIEGSTNRFLDEFEWYMKALKKQREEGTPY